MSASFPGRALSNEVNMKMRCQIASKNISLAMDGRLEQAATEALAEHLRACPSCREWQQEQSWLRDLVRAPQEVAPSPGFPAGLMARIAAAPRRRPFFAFSLPVFRPVLLRAAMLFLIVFSALLGFFLSGRLEAPAASADMAAFSQTMNLDAFADAPAGSFAAVYDRLLQGELQ
jgi:predicted anti-sigma-YlaC factor YlaD